MKNKKIFCIGIAVLAVISFIILVQIIMKNSENKMDYKNENKLNDSNYNVVKNTNSELSNSENNKVKSKVYEDKDKQWNEIFYEKKIDNNIIIRVVSKGHIMAR